MLERLAAPVFLFAAFYATEARADVTSWFYAGGGAGRQTHDQGPTDKPSLMQLEMGVGSPSYAPVIVGGLLKTFTYFGQGTDLALVMRGATGGFARGNFGVALDAGGYRRWWGVDNSTGFMGSIILGAPFGLQLAATTERGPRVQVYAATIGVDFLRLTVYRTALSSFWPNPFPPANADGSR